MDNFQYNVMQRVGMKIKCSSGNFSEDEFKAIILAEINKIITPDYKGLLKLTNKEVFDTTGLKQKASALTDELTSLSAEIDRLVGKECANGGEPVRGTVRA